MKKIFIVTGEASGDVHAAHLLKELYKILPSEHTITKAIGGEYLKEAGADIFFNCEHLGAMGLTEVIKNLELYLSLEREVLFELYKFNPDLLILIDFPGFNLRLVKKVKKKFSQIKVVYYLPPQVWAWNQGRTKILAKYCDLVLCGLPFEEEFHRKRGVNAYYVGSPVFSELENFDRGQIRTELGVTDKDKLIGIFPGSRQSEIHYMLPVLLKAADLLFKTYPNYKFMLSQAKTIPDLEKKVSDFLQKNITSRLYENIKLLSPGSNHKLLCASDFVWLKSGTVTLEAALYETPMILGYKGNQINHFLYLILKRVDMIGLPNIIVGEKIVPELIQDEATPDTYYQITKDWLQVPGRLEKIKKNLKLVKGEITDKDASKEAALKIKDLFFPDYKVL